MMYLLAIPFLAGASIPMLTSLTALQITSSIDLVDFIVAIWAWWSSASLPIGGNLRQAIRLISWGILAFAGSHLFESVTRGLHVLINGPDILVTQGAVLASMLFFVPGLAGLADALPVLQRSKQSQPPVRVWPLAVGLAITIGLLSFIVYGFSPQAEILALLGLDGSLVFIAGLCVFLFLRARIGGVIGRSLWFAVLGLLLFSLAHPLQAWLYEVTGLSTDALAVLHRLISSPAFILFAVSIIRLARGFQRGVQLNVAPGSIARSAPDVL